MNIMKKCQTTPTCVSGAKISLGVLAAYLKCTAQMQKEERSRFHNQVSSCLTSLFEALEMLLFHVTCFGAQQALPRTADISKMQRLLNFACGFPQPTVQKKHLLT